ncbi:hypothetical protein PGTUg99_037049 [Puccinia graminis f. sp. tritici]|uniref:Uncharacterized protein n=1 Tax=Puccinia graminis f. sp. tritici TaxID=56615 RepID=A0A5B0R9N1_PUCGR|nr:hypothetical protein PGTUg99_037049 [Puccinia graminis f. sp. tritici]
MSNPKDLPKSEIRAPVLHRHLPSPLAVLTLRAWLHRMIPQRILTRRRPSIQIRPKTDQSP